VRIETEGRTLRSATAERDGTIEIVAVGLTVEEC
jgi:hypothetical protein